MFEEITNIWIVTFVCGVGEIVCCFVEKVENIQNTPSYC
jgi:hypothetical protein